MKYEITEKQIEELSEIVNGLNRLGFVFHGQNGSGYLRETTLRLYGLIQRIEMQDMDKFRYEVVAKDKPNEVLAVYDSLDTLCEGLGLIFRMQPGKFAVIDTRARSVWAIESCIDLDVDLTAN